MAKAHAHGHGPKTLIHSVLINACDRVSDIAAEQSTRMARKATELRSKGAVSPAPPRLCWS